MIKWIEFVKRFLSSINWRTLFSNWISSVVTLAMNYDEKNSIRLLLQLMEHHHSTISHHIYRQNSLRLISITMKAFRIYPKCTTRVRKTRDR